MNKTIQCLNRAVTRAAEERTVLFTERGREKDVARRIGILSRAELFAPMIVMCMFPFTIP